MQTDKLEQLAKQAEEVYMAIHSGQSTGKALRKLEGRFKRIRKAYEKEQRNQQAVYRALMIRARVISEYLYVATEEPGTNRLPWDWEYIDRKCEDLAAGRIKHVRSRYCQGLVVVERPGVFQEVG